MITGLIFVMIVLGGGFFLMYLVARFVEKQRAKKENLKDK